MDEKKFKQAVEYYKKNLDNMKGKNILVVMGLSDEMAYYSIAPFSKAVHEKEGDIHVTCFDGHSQMMESMLKVWKIHRAYKNNEKSAAVKAFSDFIRFSSKKAKENIENTFKAPDYIIKPGREGFVGSYNLEYKHTWVKKRKEKTLLKTSATVWEQVFDLKKQDRVGLGFETIPAENNSEIPLKDYLDSFVIIRSMMQQALKVTNNVTLSASSPRDSMLKNTERTGDLKATIMGCELSKNIDEAVFKRWKNFSRFIGSTKIKTNTVSFFISGKGVPGKHAFGQAIGYPTPNKKTRWQSPAGIIYQPPHAPQTRHDSRPPKARVGFTETLPVEVFIKTNNVDWLKMKNKNAALAKVAMESEKFCVRSNSKRKYKTGFDINLVKENGKKRKPLTSDVETRNIINKSHYKETGVKAGTMANIPGGEMFITPEDVKGTIVGDVVINIDQSYRLNPKNPIVVEAKKAGYKILKGPKKILDEFDKKKKEARKIINKQAKVMPKELIDVRKRNFNSIGEFAINTNPKAEVCDYLIVNEKIAGMIHIALGSGFEDDKATDYHSDIVIDAKAQKLDIYGVDKDKNRLWVMKKGKLLV